MEPIPAIDLKDGLVVRATSEQRQNYPPLRTALFPQAKPDIVVQTLLQYHTFKTIYLADLNAIMHHSHNYNIIKQVARHFMGVTFWVDVGLRNIENYWMLRELASNIVPVVATETFPKVEVLDSLTTENYVLSLDFKHHRLLGHIDFLHASAQWPSSVLVLSLDAIRQGAPDHAAVETVIAQNIKKRRLVAGGGVRCSNDLSALQAKGIHGVLLGTALYEGHLFTTR